MNNGAWWATVHGVAESDMIEHTCIQGKKKVFKCHSWRYFWKPATDAKTLWVTLGLHALGVPMYHYMAAPTQWTWIWVGSESWWWTGMPGPLLPQWWSLQRMVKIELQHKGACTRSVELLGLDGSSHRAPCSLGVGKRTECMCMLSHFSCVQLIVTLWTVACQAPLSLGILQARMLEWVAMPSSRESSWPRDRTHASYISCIGRWVIYH